MSKISRLYNQNVISFWTTIIIIAFIILIIQFFNYLAKINNEEEKNENVTQSEYDKESQSIISENNVAKEDRTTYGKLIDTFLKYCIDGQKENAYDLLSNDCKKIYFKTIQDFENLYLKNRFNENKTYTFQSWIAGRKNIYQIQIFDDILSTGNSENSVDEDYYTVVKEGTQYKLNINNYIGSESINKENVQDDITIKVNNVNIYKDYSIYTINITNDSDKTIKLDSREKSDTTYLEDKNGVKFIGLLYENLDKDLIVEKGEEKTLNIKFNVIYREDLDLQKIVFSNVIKDYNDNMEIFDDIVSVEIAM